MSKATYMESFARATPPFYVFNEPEGYRISIPVKSTWLVAVPALLFQIACGLAVLYGLDRLLRFEGVEGAGLVSALAIVGMTAGCGCVLYWWLWMVGGGETLVIHEDRISLQRDILGITRTREYDLLFVRDLRLELLPPTPLTHLTMINWRGGGGCCVTFDFHGEPQYFGIGLFEDEANDLVAAIRRRVHIPNRPGRRRSGRLGLTSPE